jgi:hypothetical protein
MERNIRITVAVVGLVLLALVPAVANAEQSARGFSWAGTCTEPIFATYVETAVADKFVPDRFKVKEAAPGKVLFSLTGGECHDFSVNDEPQGSYQFSEALVEIVAPDGSGDTHFYNLWQVVDSAPLRAHWNSLGMYGARVEELSVETSAGALASAGSVTSPWKAAPYELTVETSGPQAPLGDSEFDKEGGNGWHLGPHGVVQSGFKLSGYSPSEPRWGQVGTATVKAPAGSPMAELLGATETAGIGILSRFSFVGKARLIPGG